MPLKFGLFIDFLWSLYLEDSKQNEIKDHYNSVNVVPVNEHVSLWVIAGPRNYI